MIATLGASSACDSIGRWGEQLVSMVLERNLPSVSVHWLNAGQEQGLPYDIEVCERGRPDKPLFFVEVKTTSSLTKPLFELSLAELDFARQKGSLYVIYRVFGADSLRAKVVQLHNPAKYLTARGGSALTLYVG
jgi:hypothetical protein